MQSYGQFGLTGRRLLAGVVGVVAVGATGRRRCGHKTTHTLQVVRMAQRMGWPVRLAAGGGVHVAQMRIGPRVGLVAQWRVSASVCRWCRSIMHNVLDRSGSQSLGMICKVLICTAWRQGKHHINLTTNMRNSLSSFGRSCDFSFFVRMELMVQVNLC